MASSARNSLDKEYDGANHVTTSSPHSLSRAVYARRAEYIRPARIRVKIGSWNVAACPYTERDLAGWFIEGKGINMTLAGLRIADAIAENCSQDNVEDVGAQEDRLRRKESTIPKGDRGTIVGGEEIGLYVLGLQEVVELTAAKEYIGRVYSDTGAITKWRKALLDALPIGYEVIVEQQLSGLLLFICASPTVAPTISNISTVSIGTGIMGYLGNKGAVTTRLVIGESTRMVFVNCHLASGADSTHLDRRCWDVTQILSRTHFEPISWAGVLEDKQEAIGEEDFAFWFGDLNFRLDGLPGDDIRRLLLLHTRGEYDLGQKSRSKIDAELGGDDSPIIIHSVESDDDSEDDSNPRTSSTFDARDDDSSTSLPDPDDFIQDPSQDPASLQATLDSLLPHDQLRHVIKKQKAFHDGWREGPITFLPTYKYDVGSMGMFDTSEKKRAPSWCDRILYRTRADKIKYEGKAAEEKAASMRDEEMKARGMDHANEDDDVLFDYNPDDDGEEPSDIPEPTVESNTTGKDFYDEYDEGDDETPVDMEGRADNIHLDVYTSHQRVLSSDHKPLNAVFTLDYDAVVPEMKSKIQQEVARELDRAENEGRPGITVVVDHSQEVDDISQDATSNATPPAVGETEGINFGAVSFRKRKTRGLTIANTSQVVSTFSFVERPGAEGEGEQIAPPWLTLAFVGSETDLESKHDKELTREVELEPGESVNCTLELFIDDVALVRSLNESEIQLDDILVLRVKDGRDHFIPIRGSWLQSCFGRSIDELIRVPEGGVRALLPRRKGSGGPVNRGQEVRWSAPRELFKLTEAVESLTERVNADASMIENAQLPKESAGWPFDEKTWLLKDAKTRERHQAYPLEALDSDKSIINSFPVEIPAIERLEIVAEISILWLKSLTDGIIPSTLWEKLDGDITARGAKQLTDVEETKNWVLDILSTSPNHNIAFVFLTSMLSRVANELAPMPKPIPGWQEMVGNARGSLGTVRRSLSWKGKTPPSPSEPLRLRRMAVEKAFSETFAGVIFRGPVLTKDKEKRTVDERRRYILEAFLHGGGPG